MADLPDISGVWGQTLRDVTSPQADLTRQQVLLTQQQTAQEAMKNRLSQLQLNYAQALPGALAASMNGGSQSGGAGDSDSGFGLAQPDPGSNAAGSVPVNASSSDERSGVDVNSSQALINFRQRYAPVPAGIYSPQEQQTLALAALSGTPGAVDLAKQQHQMRVDAINQTRAKDAQTHYNNFYGVVTAPEGRALDALSFVDRKEAKRYKAAGATDDQVRSIAAKLAGAIHVSAQMPVEFTADGTARDSTTKQEVPGYDAVVGMGPKERAELTKSATELVETYVDGVPAKVPRWKSQGADSPADWLAQQAQMAATLKHGTAPTTATQPQPSPTLPWGRSSQPAPQQTPGGPAPSGASPQPPTQKPAAQPTPQPGPHVEDWRTTNASAKIFNDSDFKLQAPKIPAGQEMPPAVQDEQKAIAKARTDLLQQQSEKSQAAGQALRYYQLASDVLNGGGVTTGWSQQHVNQVSSALQQLGIPSTWLGDPSKAAELTKALTNAGLQSLKSTYGSKVTQNEVFLNLEHANPNADMPLPALRRLINDQVDNLTYDTHTADRARKYLATGNDPRSFDQFNQKYFPREKDAVTPQSSSAFVVGKTYKDKSGNTAKYLGGGKWQ